MSSNFAAGEVTRPGKHNVQTLPVKAVEVLAQGNFVKSAAGQAVKMVNTDVNLAGVFVALEKVTGGAADGDEEIQVAGPGSEVTVLAGGAIQPGGLIKVDAASKAIAAIAGDVELDKTVGRYIKKPGEDKASAAAASDVVVIILSGGT